MGSTSSCCTSLTISSFLLKSIGLGLTALDMVVPLAQVLGALLLEQGQTAPNKTGSVVNLLTCRLQQLGALRKPACWLDQLGTPYTKYKQETHIRSQTWKLQPVQAPLDVLKPQKAIIVV